MGAPVGNQNGAKAKVWTAAIERALAKRSALERKEAIEEIANALIDKCLDGDMTAIREFGDRMEGRPTQTVAGDPENPLTIINKVERAIIRPKD